MARVYLALGTNEGDREKFLEQALLYIEANLGQLDKKSSVYETASWGYDDADYLNMVVTLETKYDPEMLLESCLDIEKQLGRERQGETENYTSRCIDIDVLYYEDRIWKDGDLLLPHPRLHQRRFVLVPLVEIAPEYQHPVLKKTHRELLGICADQLQVNHYE